jgi:endoglucanase
MVWAAVELFLVTKQRKYFDDFLSLSSSVQVPSWSNVDGLAYISLVRHAKELLSPVEYTKIRSALIESADSIVKQHKQSSYRVAMEKNDFVWGSNAVALNKAMLLIEASAQADKPEYWHATTAIVDYVFGRNPTGFSFVTGFGDKKLMGIHHRPSEADGISEPVPGFVAGGPQAGQQDGCSYPSKDPAKSFLDDWCSYSTNEITINWNAPLVYVLAALNSRY